ncbi:hypothetical protein MLD38_019846 [Melastoma candidum]|uniref:Uncharacterized protein n=1 Tax=Melastoma candidum TaxID=119954 RepID=A0ACB9QBA7_9MYRT|nr:hypothetical protein MLD38_019846 [Melastoma candidum]
MKRIPRIKFPKRHSPPDAKSTSQVASTPSSQMTAGTSDVPPPPRNLAVGGKASLQPKRTPVSDREIEAILLGGCF